MSNQQLRMRAYYYGFQLTGEPEIDLILSAVASAGKSFHHTDQWNEEVSPEDPHTGNSPVDWIKNAATLAAQISKQAKVENYQLRAEVAGLRTGYEAYERVNAELKAESETLTAAAQALRDEWRKDQADAQRYQWLRDSSQYDWDVSYGKLELRIETPHDDSGDLDACIDAAMGKGEQS